MQQTIELGPLGVEEVEIAVENCGLCHSDLSMFNNDWGMTQFPAIFGHEVVGRISALGPGTKGLNVGQRVGLGWTAAATLQRSWQVKANSRRRAGSAPITS